MNVNNQLPTALTPENGSDEEMDWEVATKRNPRKQRKDEKKNAGRTKAKPDAILIRKKDPNATFASVLNLIKDKVDKEQVIENNNKIRQTKTEDVLVQLQRGINATHLKEAVTTAIGSEATVLQLSQQVALDVRDIDMDTTEGEVQKALVETAGVLVEALKVKAMHPMYGGMQMAVVTMPRMIALYIIKSGKVRIGWVISRVRDLSSEVFQVHSLWAPLAQLRQREQCIKTVLSMRGHGSPCCDLQPRTGVHAVRGDGC